MQILLAVIRWLYNKIKITTNLLQKIYDETQPNHGSSLFDRLKRIENIVIMFHNINQLLLSTYKDGIYECDENGKCIWTNKALQDIFGLDEVEMLGNGWLRCICQEDRIDVWDYWKECIEKNIPYEAEYKVVNYKTNKTFLIETIAKPNVDDRGKILGYFGVLRVLEEIDE